MYVMALARCSVLNLSSSHFPFFASFFVRVACSGDGIHFAIPNFLNIYLLYLIERDNTLRDDPKTRYIPAAQFRADA
ncbi:hypothetical protein BDW42DRAFT_32877 [Aspergillus taichungensis]|uniref:Uncharacterized protein n=1 Tax=Aspergillus taichungensis TaxID=482145 RepID=A0A2J5HG08_9EURO|nr:hypothetical protein BDW42DRAFT_32877 [Aspergillus taichungensis]